MSEKEKIAPEQIIALDTGSGDNKVMTVNGTFKFPSAIERVRESSTGFGANDTDTIFYNGYHYRVGEKALNNPITTRGFGFLESYSPISLYEAIRRAGLDMSKPIGVKVGLSIKDWHKSDEYIKALSNIIVNGEKLNTEVVALFAQGQGSYIDAGSPKGLVVVVDIGYNTLDFLIFEDGKALGSECFATTRGANVIIRNIQSMLNKEYHTEISEQKAKDAFNKGAFRDFGQTIDISDKIQLEKDKYVEELIEELRNRSGDVLRNADKVIFTGGGAYFIEGAELPPNAELGNAPYEFSNARGYFNG